jgi:hypothetical protein
MAFGFSVHNFTVFACCLVVLFLELLSMIEAHVNVRDLEFLEASVGIVEENREAIISLSGRSISQSFGVKIYAIPDDAPLKNIKFNLLPRGLGAYAKHEVLEALFGFRDGGGLAIEEFEFSTISRSVAIRFKSRPRGAHQLPKLVVVSMFPFGMFRVWREIVLDQKYSSYPAPRGRSFSERNAGQSNKSSGQEPLNRLISLSEDDYSHHDEYKRGDSIRRVDWRASSRKGSKVVKVFASHASNDERVLRWSDTRGLSGEDRLSELSLWIHESYNKRLVFKLEIPGVISHFGSGFNHFESCLKILANYNLEMMAPGASI